MNIKTIVVGYLKENCYILEKNGKCIIIDPGDEFDKICSEINCSVLCILITHNHFDHIGALEELKNKYNAPVYDYNNLKEKDISIDDFRFRVIYTLGHTLDSITYYFYDDNVMFTGDFIFKGCIGRTDFGGDDTCMNESIKKIKKYNDKIILYPGHGDSTTLGYEKENNVYMRRML